jgi:5'-phosphate synthase pdxT subunit
MVNVGILAVQGDFAAHAAAVSRASARPIFVRKPVDLLAVDALVLPGGESTAMLRGLARDGLDEPLASFLRSGRPVLGTCAGAILLARRVTNPEQPSFGTLDIDVERNAYGTQLESFESPLDGAGLLTGLHGTFIRAPRIVRTGPSVEVLARHDDTPVLVRDEGVWAATFHPELGSDDRVFRLWLSTPVRLRRTPPHTGSLDA